MVSLLSKSKIVGTEILIDDLYKLNFHPSYFESLYVNSLSTKRTLIKESLESLVLDRAQAFWIWCIQTFVIHFLRFLGTITNISSLSQTITLVMNTYTWFMRNLNHLIYLTSIKLKLKINRMEKLKLLDLTVVVSTMADTTD